MTNGLDWNQQGTRKAKEEARPQGSHGAQSLFCFLERAPRSRNAKTEEGKMMENLKCKNKNLVSFTVDWTNDVVNQKQYKRLNDTSYLQASKSIKVCEWHI
jgi:hypothetical protein